MSETTALPELEPTAQVQVVDDADPMVNHLKSLYKLNTTPRKPDQRDYLYHVIEEKQLIVVKKNNKLKISKITANKTPPTTFSLQTSLSPILDQGSLGSCVTNAFALNVATQTKSAVKPSRLFHYANCRILQGSLLSDDSGTDVRTACNAILNYGACQETVWPYNVNNYSVYPPLTAFQGTKKFRTFTYTFINQNLSSLQTALSTNKTPIVFGFLVYTSFMSNNVAKNGVVPIPNTNTETLQGGHCMTIIGYDNTNQWFICANSWGNSWGNKGICYIPYSYLLNPNLAFDFCQATFVY